MITPEEDANPNHQAMKAIASLEAETINAEKFKKYRDKPMILRNEIDAKTKENMNWKNLKKAMPNLSVQLVESLAKSEKTNNTAPKVKYYSNLHDYIDYCLGEEASFTVQTGEFDIKHKRIRAGDFKLYLLNLNCNKHPKLSTLIKLKELYGDWFSRYFPQYKDVVVYDKGHTWFFIGPEGTESELHSDHNHVHTTLQQCDGSKEVFLVDPNTTNSLIQKYGRAIKLIEQNGMAAIKGSSNEVLSPELDEMILHGKLESGDTLYIPANWGHMVRSLSKSITVSRDFIDERNADAYFTSMITQNKC